MSNVFNNSKVHVMPEKCGTCIFATRIPQCPDTPCVEWTGAKSSGYGVRRIAGKIVRVHRLTWEEANGPIGEGQIVMHLCDNPACYRLDHLALGTHKMNSDDKFQKGRANTLRGEATGRARLTERQVFQVLERLDKGESQRSIAKVFGVSAGCIQHIAEGRNWKHLVQPRKVSNLMRLRPGRVKGMVDDCLRDGGVIPCHKTIHGQREQEAVCRGFFDAYAPRVAGLRLAVSMNMIEEVEKDG